MASITAADIEQAETQIFRPGDNRLAIADMLATQPSRLNMSVHLPDGTQRPLGYIDDTIYHIENGDVVRVQMAHINGNRQIDLTQASSGLLPRKHYSQSAKRTIDLNYGEDAVTGSYEVADAEAVAVNDPVASPAFDSNHIDLIARAIPLEEGFAADIATYERAAPDSTDTAVLYRVAYEGEEDTGGAPVAIVSYARHGGSKTNIYLDPESRSLVRIEFASGGAVMVMTPAE